MSVNKMILIGNLGADPELKSTPNGQSVCTFSLATNERWTDKNGEKQERVEWTNCVAWGKTAELCQKYLSKGRQAYVEGRKQTRTYDDKDGVKRYFVECVIQQITFLQDGRRDDDGGGRRGRDDGPPPSGPPPGMDDDIPF